MFYIWTLFFCAKLYITAWLCACYSLLVNFFSSFPLKMLVSTTPSKGINTCTVPTTHAIDLSSSAGAYSSLSAAINWVAFRINYFLDSDNIKLWLTNQMV